ncbi:MAG: SelT/SelW/SelH family protein [Niabella sp.]
MKPLLTIEYCPKCSWLLRSAYFAQEILTTFEEDIEGITLKPSEISGRFSIYVDKNIIFDRKQYGGFPDVKYLKQIIRDVVNPEKNLGHSDKKI